RPCFELAKRGDQMVAVLQADIVAEASSLSISDVSKNFPAPDNPDVQVLALNGVSLSIPAGELISLVGPSGCGKSTLLRLVAGLDVPSSGELLIGGQAITGPSAERGL